MSDPLYRVGAETELRPGTNRPEPSVSWQPSGGRSGRQGSPKEAPEAAPKGRRGKVHSALRAAESMSMLVGGVFVAALLAGSYEHSQRADKVLPGVQIEGERWRAVWLGASGASRGLLQGRPRSSSQPPRRGQEVSRSSRRQLGVVPVPQPTIEDALALGHGPNLFENVLQRGRALREEVDLRMAFRFDGSQALGVLTGIAPELDRPSRAASLDLESRRVIPAERGRFLLPYDSLSNVALGLASGSDSVELAVREKDPIQVAETSAWTG